MLLAQLNCIDVLVVTHYCTTNGTTLFAGIEEEPKDDSGGHRVLAEYTHGGINGCTEAARCNAPQAETAIAAQAITSVVCRLVSMGNKTI